MPGPSGWYGCPTRLRVPEAPGDYRGNLAVLGVTLGWDLGGLGVRGFRDYSSGNGWFWGTGFRGIQVGLGDFEFRIEWALRKTLADEVVVLLHPK